MWGLGLSTLHCSSLDWRGMEELEGFSDRLGDIRFIQWSASKRIPIIKVLSQTSFDTSLIKQASRKWAAFN